MQDKNIRKLFAAVTISAAVCLGGTSVTVRAEEGSPAETAEHTETKEKNTGTKKQAQYRQSLSTEMTIKAETEDTEDEVVSVTIEGWFPADFYIELSPETPEEETDPETLLYCFNAAVFTKDGKEYASRNDKITLTVDSGTLRSAEEIFVYIESEDGYTPVEKTDRKEGGLRFDLASGSTVILTSAPVEQTEEENEEETPE